MDNLSEFKNSIGLQIYESELENSEKIKYLKLVTEISGKAVLATIGVAATGLGINRNISDITRRKKRKELYAKLIKQQEQRKKGCNKNRKCIEKIEDRIIAYRIDMQK